MIFAIGILLAGAGGGLIPLWRRRESRQTRLLTWGNAFAAGIFLGAALVHMLAESADTWADDIGATYPWPFLIAGAAFFAILLFEHVLVSDDAHAVVHSVNKQLGLSAHAHGDAHLDASEHGPERSRATETYPYTLAVVLSIHSVIAGIALGAQETVASATIIFIAIIAHKSMAAFALGVSLARGALERRRALGIIAIFTVMTPIGIAIGALVGNALDSGGELYFNAIFLALAAGTFLYIATLDIIHDEFLRPGHRFAKWLLASLGFAIMGILALWV